MEKKEWILNLGMLLIGVLFVIKSLRLGLGSVHRPGSGFLPFYTGLGLGLVAFFPLIKNFLTARKGNGRDQKKFFAGSDG